LPNSPPAVFEIYIALIGATGADVKPCSISGGHEFDLLGVTGKRRGGKGEGGKRGKKRTEGALRQIKI